MSIWSWIQRAYGRLKRDRDEWSHARLCHELSAEDLIRMPLQRWERRLMLRYPKGPMSHDN
jgi:hypothetical protein